jgi:hypothetical protein
MRFRPPAIAALLLALLANCNKDYPNPFAEQIATQPPTADASLVFTSNGWSSVAGQGREPFSVSNSGASLTRLTFCNESGRVCDTLEATLAPDRQRGILLVRDQDTNGDGVLSPEDGQSLVYVDLTRQATAVLVEASEEVTGMDWSPTADLIVYSAQGSGGEDLFRTDPVRPTADNQQQTRNLTCPLAADGTTPACDRSIRERRPRIDSTGSVACYERIAADGKGQVWIFQNQNTLLPVTTGGPGSEPLTGTPYVVGSDADPDFSPNRASLVFRRLTATGNGGAGTWDILAVDVNGSNLRTLVAGSAWRGAPDWGPDGTIVFAETDPATGVPSLVRINADGSGRSTILSLAAGFRLDSPRWLAP